VIKKRVSDLRDFLARASSGAAEDAREHGVMSLDELRARRGGLVEATGEQWSLSAVRGRLVEISARGASATLTTAVGLIVEAQAANEPVAWITLPDGGFSPPDVADNGVDLAALVVVRVVDATIAARAAESVLRSGAFGLVVVDLGKTAELSMARQGRLVTLAQAHDAAVVCLTDKAANAGSLGSLVSLHAEALRRRESSGKFAVTVRALKDKRRGPGWTRSELRRGPVGWI
jgi:recombination protein RecA